jgi:hypothetical protein
MARSDQIFVMRPLMGMEGVYEHHGIDCGDGTVIHYSKVPQEPTILRVPWREFSWNQTVRVRHYAASFIPDVVIERAESRLGEKRYSLLTNNCEHFATWCKVGKSESRQIIDYGLPSDTLKRLASSRLIESAAKATDPVETLSLFDHALQNTAIAQIQLEAQHYQATTEMDTWHRVAQLALKQGKETATRAALRRKVEQKRRVEALEENMAQMGAIAQDLQKNVQFLQDRTNIQRRP